MAVLPLQYRNRKVRGQRRRRAPGIGVPRESTSQRLTEAEIQGALWQYLNKLRVYLNSYGQARLPGTADSDVNPLAPALAVGDFSYHVPNGIWVPGQPAATARIIASLKKKGFRNGVSDIVIALPTDKYHGAYLELKRDRKSEIRPEQISWLAMMQSVGYYAAMAFGLDEAILRVQEFLRGKDPPPLPSA